MDVKVSRLVAVIKNYRSIVLGSIIFMVVVTFFIGKVPPFSLDTTLLYPVFFAGLFIIFLLFRGYRISRIAKMETLLYDNCDPDAFLRIFGEFVGRLNDADINTDIFAYDIRLGFEMYWLKLCEGIIASGDCSSALEILYDLAGYKPEKQVNVFGVLYQRQLCAVNLELDNTDAAEENLDCLIKSVALLKSRDSAKYEKHLEWAQYSVNIARGVYDYAEKAFGDLFDKAENNYERVNSKFALAKVYLHSGDVPRAKEALEYVIAHGNKLHIVEEANERLAQFQE